MKNSVIYTDDSGRHFRHYGGTWAWRNNNPGNIRPGNISKRHNQIGIVNNFAVFPDYESGHEALLDALHTTFANMSIDKMMEQYAPPGENNTAKYRKFVHEKTGVMDDREIRDFTDEEFKKLWFVIEQMEGFKIGEIVEVFHVTNVQQKNGSICNYCIEQDGWISKEKCVELARAKSLELEVCVSRLGNTFLRTAPSSEFQQNLNKIIQ